MLKGFTVVDKTVLGTIGAIVTCLVVAFPLVGNAESKNPMIIYLDDQGEDMQEADLAGRAWEVIEVEDVYYMRDADEPLVPSVTLKRMTNVVVAATTFNYGQEKYTSSKFKEELLRGTFSQ